MNQLTTERKQAMDEAARLLGLKIVDYKKAHVVALEP